METVKNHVASLKLAPVECQRDREIVEAALENCGHFKNFVMDEPGRRDKLLWKQSKLMVFIH